MKLTKLGNWLIDKILPGLIVGSILLVAKVYVDLPEAEKENFFNFQWITSLMDYPVKFKFVILSLAVLILAIYIYGLITKQRRLLISTILSPNCTSIKYLTWDNSKWEANLGKLNCFWVKKKFTSILSKVSDPEFEHIGYDTHKDKVINYLADNGEKWQATCKSHLTPGGIVTFTFIHTKEGNNSSHESPNIRFLDWDKKLWDATIAPMQLRKSSDTTITFICH